MNFTTMVTKGRRAFRSLRRTDTGSAGDDQTSTLDSISDKPPPKLPETDQLPGGICVPNDPENLPMSSVAASESKIPTDLPNKDPKKPEEANLREEKVDNAPPSMVSSSNKLNLVESSHQGTRNLWDVAYDNLRPQHADLIEKYERILTLWLRADSLQQNSAICNDDEQRNLFQHSHHQERRQYARDIVTFCLDAQQESDTHTDTDTDDESNKNFHYQSTQLKFCKQTQDILKSSIDNVEDAALAWVGTCLALQAILTSIDRPEKLRGIRHVASRMAWYTLLPKLLDGDEYNEGLPLSEQTILQGHIIELYQRILLFQIRIVCSQIVTTQENDLVQIDQSLLPRDIDLNEADVVEAEQALMCFNGYDIEIQIQNLATLLNEKNVKNGDEKPEPTKSDTKSPMEILNAIDPQKNNSEANSLSVKNLYEWINSTSKYRKFVAGDSRVLWVCGDPDAGRTMVTWSIVHGLSLTNDSESRFLSFSMCGTGENETESAVSVLKTLIYLVLEHQPRLSIHLIDKCRSIGREEFFESNDVYTLTMLLYDIIRDGTFQPTIFLIGGIDDINFEHEDRRTFISIIKTTMKLSQKVQWLISSSTDSFDKFIDLHVAKDDCIDIDAAYEEIQKTLNDHYIPSKIDQMVKDWSIAGDFRVEITELLQNASAGNFLRVDLACQAIQRDNPWHAPSILKWLSQAPTAFSDPLYNLYAPMREDIKNLPFNDSEICINILSTMATAARSLDLVELEELLGFPEHFNIRILVERCFAFLEIRNKTVYFSRKSARDFILKETESERAGLHSQMAERCLQTLSEYWSLPLTNSLDSRNKNSNTPTNYVTLYWAQHLCDVNDADDVIYTAVGFLNKYLLEWLDLLVDLKYLSQAKALVSALQNHVEESWKIEAPADDSPYWKFLSIIYETHRLLHFHSMIHSATSLTARMTLLFCPSITMIQKTFLSKEWPYLEGPPMFKNYWDPFTHILKGHSDYIRCCAYSYDGRMLASGSDDGTIRLWDTSSGKAQYTLQAFRNDYVYNIALSSAGFIAASNQTIIKIWNLSTGEELKLPVEPSTVGDIKFSNDGTLLAAALGGEIVFWRTPDCKLILRQENYPSGDNIRFIKFSKNDSLLGTVSKRIITIWSLENEVIEEVMNGTIHDSRSSLQNDQGLKREKILTLPDPYHVWAYGVAFSPNSKYVATGTDEDCKVYIWDWNSENSPIELTGHMGGINTVEFSSDGLFLASGSQDGTIRMWREPWAAEQPPLVLSGHSRSVYDLSFSPSETCLATCSSDETVRIWDYGSYKAQPRPEIDSRQTRKTSHARPISRIALSEDGKWVASASGDGMICLWDGRSGMLQQSLWEHKQDVESLVFSHDCRKLVSGSDDRTVRIWSLENGFQSRTLFGHRDWVRCAVLSRDGTLVVSGSDDRTVRIWSLMQPEVGRARPNQEEEEEQTEEIGESNDVRGVKTLRGHRDYVMCVLFSQDEKYVVSGSDDGEIIFWDLHPSHQADTSAESTIIQTRSYERITAMTFSADSRLFIASNTESISIWNTNEKDGNMRFEYVLKVKTGSVVHSLSANIDYPQYVITERGPLLIQDLRDGAKAKIVPEPWCPYSVTSDTESWITWNGKKIILLPDLYHPASVRDSHAIRVHKDRVIVGCQTGEVLIFRFQKDANWLDAL